MGKYRLNFLPPKIYVLTLFENKIIADLKEVKMRTLGWALI